MDKELLKIDALAKIVAPTQGILLYQEQIIQISRDIASFSEEEADSLRKAMGKKKKEIMEELKGRFIEGAVGKGYERSIAEKIFDAVEQYSSYCFVKSHSLAYAMTSYITAYLKYYHPAHFISASINARLVKSTAKRESVAQRMMHEARRLKIEVARPSINESDFLCKVTAPKRLVLGLGCIKGMGSPLAQTITSTRQSSGKFQDLEDFCSRTWNSRVEKGKTQLLIEAGALDCLGRTRKAMIESLPEIEKKIKKLKKEATGQLSLFADKKEKISEKEYPLDELSLRELECFGFFVEGHPLDNIETPTGAIETLEELEQIVINKKGSKVAIPLFVQSATLHITKSRKEEMIYLEGEDRDFNRIKITVFPSLWKRKKADWAIPQALVGKCLLVAGKAESRYSIAAEDFAQLTQEKEWIEKEPGYPELKSLNGEVTR